MKHLLLTESDRRILQDAVDVMKQQKVNTYLVSEQNEFLNTPDVYVAYPPSAGISALGIVPGTGTSSSDHDTPGKADCDIYKVVHNKLFPVIGLSKVVYNLSTTAIPQQFVGVYLTKYGTWVVDCPCIVAGTATATITTGCNFCPDGAPVQWELTVAGFTDQTCTNCDSFNGVFTLTYLTDCQWTSDEEGLGCSAGIAPLWNMNITSGPGMSAQPKGISATSWIDFSIDCLGANVLSRSGPNPSGCTMPSTISLQPL